MIRFAPDFRQNQPCTSTITKERKIYSPIKIVDGMKKGLTCLSLNDVKMHSRSGLLVWKVNFFISFLIETIYRPLFQTLKLVIWKLTIFSDSALVIYVLFVYKQWYMLNCHRYHKSLNISEKPLGLLRKEHKVTFV